MGEIHFMISEAAKRVNVETHVLRYWEEELELPIGRTEMGHRYYTEENIQLFRCIKELKEQGIFLKDLKGLIPDMIQAKALKVQKPKELMSELSVAEPDVVVDEKLQQVQGLIGDVLQNVITENNKVLENAMTNLVSDKVIKEMDFLLQAKERQEEERFKRLDHIIRQQQTNRRESAARNAGHAIRRLLGVGN